MRRTLLIAALTLLLLVVATSVLVESRAVDEPLPPPDPAMPIQQLDGTVLPLAEVLARANAPVPAPPVDLLPLVTVGDAQVPPEEVARLVQTALDLEPAVFRLAEVARREGRLDEALALYLSIPEDDDAWPRAQRRIGWDILTEGKGDPRRGIAYVQAALRREPFDGNSWQDATRVYAGVLGFDVD